jgi:hypothetical protein
VEMVRRGLLKKPQGCVTPSKGASQTDNDEDATP